MAIPLATSLHDDAAPWRPLADSRCSSDPGAGTRKTCLEHPPLVSKTWQWNFGSKGGLSARSSLVPALGGISAAALLLRAVGRHAQVGQAKAQKKRYCCSCHPSSTSVAIPSEAVHGSLDLQEDKWVKSIAIATEHLAGQSSSVAPRAQEPLLFLALRLISSDDDGWLQDWEQACSSAVVPVDQQGRSSSTVASRAQAWPGALLGFFTECMSASGRPLEESELSALSFTYELASAAANDMDALKADLEKFNVRISDGFGQEERPDLWDLAMRFRRTLEAVVDMAKSVGLSEPYVRHVDACFEPSIFVGLVEYFGAKQDLHRKLRGSRLGLAASRASRLTRRLREEGLAAAERDNGSDTSRWKEEAVAEVERLQAEIRDAVAVNSEQQEEDTSREEAREEEERRNEEKCQEVRTDEEAEAEMAEMAQAEELRTKEQELESKDFHQEPQDAGQGRQPDQFWSDPPFLGQRGMIAAEERPLLGRRKDEETEQGEEQWPDAAAAGQRLDQEVATADASIQYEDEDEEQDEDVDEEESQREESEEAEALNTKDRVDELIAELEELLQQMQPERADNRKGSVSSAEVVDLPQDKIEDEDARMFAADGEFSRLLEPPDLSAEDAAFMEDDELPIMAFRDEIIERIQQDRVSIVIGSTGCGKSTQVPQFLLEEDSSFRILVTQPRRVAATEIAARVAKERGEELGRAVGYRIGGESVCGPLSRTRLQFATVGYTLAWLLNNPQVLGNFTHIVLDEVHERSSDSDMLMALVKMLLGMHKNIKVVLMSATIDPKIFERFFANVLGHGGLSPVMVPGRIFPVKEVFVDDLFQEDITLPLPGLRKSLKQLLDGCAVACEGEGWMLSNPRIAMGVDEGMPGLISYLARPGCTVLVFLPGIADIEDLGDMLWNAFSKSHPQGAHDVKEFRIFVLHSQAPKEAEVFQRPAPGVCHVVLASNIAESSVTLPNVTAVVDFCLTRQVFYDSVQGVSRLETNWSSKASARQRAGRAGRTQPGVCLRMVSRRFFDEVMMTYDQPEVLRSSLVHLVLQAKQLSRAMVKVSRTSGIDLGIDTSSLDNILDQLPLRPSRVNLRRTIKQIADAGAFTHNGPDADFTSLGLLAQGIRVDLPACRLVWLGCHLGCAPEAVIMAAACSCDDPFMSPSLKYTHPENYVNELKQSFLERQRFDAGDFSEPLMCLRLFQEWLFIFRATGTAEGNRSEWASSCKRMAAQVLIQPSRMVNFITLTLDIAQRTLRMRGLDDLPRQQLEELVELIRFGEFEPQDWLFQADGKLLKATLAIAFGDQLLVSRRLCEPPRDGDPRRRSPKAQAEFLQNKKDARIEVARKAAASEGSGLSRKRQALIDKAEKAMKRLDNLAKMKASKRRRKEPKMQKQLQALKDEWSMMLAEESALKEMEEPEEEEDDEDEDYEEDDEERWDEEEKEEAELPAEEEEEEDEDLQIEEDGVEDDEQDKPGQLEDSPIADLDDKWKFLLEEAEKEEAERQERQAQGLAAWADLEEEEKKQKKKKKKKKKPETRKRLRLKERVKDMELSLMLLPMKGQGARRHSICFEATDMSPKRALKSAPGAVPIALLPEVVESITNEAPVAVRHLSGSRYAGVQFNRPDGDAPKQRPLPKESLAAPEKPTLPRLAVPLHLASMFSGGRQFFQVGRCMVCRPESPYAMRFILPEKSASDGKAQNQAQALLELRNPVGFPMSNTNQDFVLAASSLQLTETEGSVRTSGVSVLDASTALLALAMTCPRRNKMKFVVQAPAKEGLETRVVGLEICSWQVALFGNGSQYVPEELFLSAVNATRSALASALVVQEESSNFGAGKDEDQKLSSRKRHSKKADKAVGNEEDDTLASQFRSLMQLVQEPRVAKRSAKEKQLRAKGRKKGEAQVPITSLTSAAESKVSVLAPLTVRSIPSSSNANKGNKGNKRSGRSKKGF